jgi:hypothetical protein
VVIRTGVGGEPEVLLPALVKLPQKKSLIGTRSGSSWCRARFMRSSLRRVFSLRAAWSTLRPTVLNMLMGKGRGSALEARVRVRPDMAEAGSEATRGVGGAVVTRRRDRLVQPGYWGGEERD